MKKYLFFFFIILLLVGCNNDVSFNPNDMKQSIKFMEETFSVESSISDEKDYQTNELVKLIGFEHVGYMVASSKEKIYYVHFYSLNLKQAEDILKKFELPVSEELKTHFNLSKEDYEDSSFAKDEVFYKYKDYAVQATRDRHDPTILFLTLIFDNEYIQRYEN